MKIDRARVRRDVRPDGGDRVRLADTELVVEVERDLTIYGEEVKFGGGKVIRDGMGQSQRVAPRRAPTPSSPTRSSSTDWGIVKGDIGIKDGRIARLGKAGNPDIQPGVDIVIGAGHRDHRRRRHDRHRRRHRRAHPLHLPAADRGGADVGRHDDDRRRHRARRPARSRPPARRARGTSTACSRRPTRFR